MTTLHSLKKKCRQLEEQEKWQELSETYNKVATNLRSIKEYEEALEYHKKDRKLSEKTKDVKADAHAIRMIGEIYVEKGECYKAQKYFKEYRVRSRELQDPVMEQRALANLGWLYYNMALTDSKMFPEALKYFIKCYTAVGKISTTSCHTKERQEMRGGALENIGNTYFMIGDMEAADQKLREAEKCYLESRNWACLHRVEINRANQLLESSASPTDLAQALTQANKALKTGERVGSKARVESLCTMFKVYLVQRDFTSARSSLIEARRLNAGDMGRFIDKNLKMMIVINKCLAKISTDEGLSSHCHFEGIADALLKYESCGNIKEKNKVLEVTVEYYKKAFRRAKEKGSTESLPSLNNSIAKTYEDLENYSEALNYFEKQLELDRDNPEDYCIALSNTAMMKETLQQSYDEVMKLRKKWLEQANRFGLRSQQLIALKEILRYQRDNNRAEEVRATERRLEELGGSEDGEKSCSQSSGASDNFPDIDLDEQEEVRVDRSRIARRTPAEFTKRNKKGEFPLHTEIQRADQEGKIISMIERGHPLEVEDNAGWTPLGEATGHMNINYVRILVEAGANINHRNNKKETPLLVAAERGWLDGVEYFLDNGAQVDLKSNSGNTCLSFLNSHVEEGRKGVEPDYKKPGVMKRLESAVARVEKIFENLGLSTDVPLPLESDSPCLEDDFYLADLTLVPQEDPAFTSTQKRRRSPSPCSSPRSPSPSPLSRTLTSRSPGPGRRMYQEAIQSVRNSASRVTLPIVTPRSSTVGGAEEHSEDWLVEDVRTNKRKRKRQSLVEEKLGSGSSRKSLGSENVDPVSIPSIDLTTSPLLKTSKISKLASRNKISKQPLISSLVTRSRTPSPVFPLSKPDSPSRDISQERLQPPTVQTSKLSLSSSLRVKVCISGEKFLVPVTHPTLTVGWLAKEVARRYNRQLGTEPVLRLRTKDGAALDSEDLISHVFHPEDELTGEVMHWNTKPAADKYDDACKELGTFSYRNIRASLVNMSTSNTLSLRVSLKTRHVQPLFRSLRGNSGLRKLELSYCKLKDEEVRLLCEVLPSINHLVSLDLSYNMMTSTSLSLLSKLGLKVKQMELSGNMFSDDCLEALTTLLSSYSRLEQLGLARCSLTKMLFHGGRSLFSLEVKKSKLKHLDISHNQLTAAGVEILVSCLPPGLSSLNLSNCNQRKISSPENLGSAFLSHNSQGSADCQHSNLSNLNLSWFSLDNRSLAHLKNGLALSGKLTELDLSHNLLTSGALASLLTIISQHKLPLVTLRLAVGREEEADRFWSDQGLEEVREGLESLSLLEHLVLPYSAISTSSVSRLWDRRHGARSHHQRDQLGNIVYRLD